MNGPANPLAIEDVYHDHRERLVGLARLLIGTRHQAEDVVHDVFVAVQGRWDQLEDPVRYLTRAVVNRVRDHHRRSLRWQRLGRAHERVTGIDEVDETWVQLDALAEPQRTVVILRYYADLSFDEIGGILGRPVTTIRSDHRRALQRLRRTLT